MPDGINTRTGDVPASQEFTRVIAEARERFRIAAAACDEIAAEPDIFSQIARLAQRESVS